MYTKEYKSRLQQEFWTTLGKYLAPIPSAEGMKINWVNYKTGVKNIRFYMKAESQMAEIGIKLIHSDDDERAKVFQVFDNLKNHLEGHLCESWYWEERIIEDTRVSARIFSDLKGCQVYDKEHWPAMIAYFKQRMVALDAFWCDWKYAFEDNGDSF